MSDEEDYAEYMMSEEDIESFEMDVDSDNEDGSAAELRPESDGDNSAVKDEDLQQERILKQCENWYGTGKAFKADNQWDEARKWFSKCHLDPIWRFKSLKQMIKCDLSQGVPTHSRLKELFTVLEADRDQIGGGYIEESMKGLVNKIIPDLNSQLIFSGKLRQIPIDLRWLTELQTYFGVIEEGVRNLGSELKQIVRIRKLVYTVWVFILQKNPLPKTLWQQLTEIEHLETSFLLLQLHVLRFLDDNRVEIEALDEVVDQVQKLMATSLSVSQMPTVTTVYHFAKFLAYWKNTDYYDRSQVIVKCEEELIACFRDLEALGGSKRFSSKFSQLTLIGLIFCHLLLNGDNKLSPFELEQIKVLESDELVISLKRFYNDWQDMDLNALEHSLLELQTYYSPWYEPLVQNLIVLCQSNKLWKQLAPIYSCIRLQDLITKLESENMIRMNRDDLLTLLMRSIAKDTADVYYKLDLVEDYIYFGDQYCVPLRSDEFSIVNPLSNRLGTDLVGKDEWLCNVSNWHKHNTPKKPTAMEFMDHMKVARLAMVENDLTRNSLSVTAFLLRLSTLNISQNSSMATTTSSSNAPV